MHLLLTEWAIDYEKWITWITRCSKPLGTSLIIILSLVYYKVSDLTLAHQHKNMYCSLGWILWKM